MTIPNEAGVEIYPLPAWIRQMTPMIWRRLLVRSDSTIAELHDTLPLGWRDAHLNRFHIHDQDDGVYHDGGISFSTDADQVRLCEFKFHIHEKIETRREKRKTPYWRV